MKGPATNQGSRSSGTAYWVPPQVTRMPEVGDEAFARAVTLPTRERTQTNGEAYIMLASRDQRDSYAACHHTLPHS